MPDIDAWNARYRDDNTPWDLGAAPLSLQRLIAEVSDPGRQLQVLVPGAGRGHDARAWARAGHRVVAVDFAPLAIAEGRALAEAEGVAVDFVQADVTALPQDWTDRFDLAWEQTCLCALEPQARRGYLGELARVMTPGGQVFAVLWQHGRDGGPPYDMNEAAVREAIEGHFRVRERTRIPDPSKGRDGEWLWTLALESASG